MASPNFQVTINADPTMAMQGMQGMQQTQVGGYTAAPGMIQQPPEGKAPIDGERLQSSSLVWICPKHFATQSRILLAQQMTFIPEWVGLLYLNICSYRSEGAA
ncbi:hypothetical protein TNCV_246081 [Trichonephila clavipes]|nr:hypothetical protein TNCV_246081 [Trichonephila clavipes]